MCVLLVALVFFFKQKTAYEMRISDWSSDVCSSDLEQRQLDVARSLPAPHAQRLAEVLALVGQLRVAGRVEDAADAQRAVEREAPQRLRRLLRLALQQGVERADRLAQVVEEVAHAQPDRPRHHLRVGLGQRRSEEHTSELQSLM